MSAKKSVCILGAGPNGVSIAKRFLDLGIEYDQFEASDQVGGNWYHNNPNGMSACYQSLHIDTSKYRLAYEDFPVPQSWPDFPHHSLLHAYIKDYCNHFNLTEKISFNESVVNASRSSEGIWSIETSKGKTYQYDWLVVANGHHWDPFIPEEYGNKFKGLSMHSHSYDSPFEPTNLRGKDILIVGAGNSAMDISSELSQRPIAKHLTLSTRRGVWVLPKYINGKPGDKLLAPAWMPGALTRYLAKKTIKKLVGKMSNYGLPEPDHEPLDAHPSVSGEFLTRVGSGDITVRPSIKEISEHEVIFSDGHRQNFDVIIWATGYNLSFPFFKDTKLQADDENALPLYKRMVQPSVPNLFYVGLAQPLPTLVNFGEQQSKYIAQVILGKHKLPSLSDMEQSILDDEKKFIGNYYKSRRHTIQVDFTKYVASLKKELGANWIEKTQ